MRKIPPCVEALLDYKQADEDGVFVKVSRQAIHETLQLLSLHQEALEMCRMYLEAIQKLNIANPASLLESLDKVLGDSDEREPPRRKAVPIREARMSKGGQNPPNISDARPPAPGGSGGKEG